MFQTLYRKMRGQNGWCVSIILPTEPGFQDHKKTSAVLTNAWRDAAAQLEARKVDANTVESFNETFQNLVAGFDLTASRQGLGIYINENISELVHFPFEVSRQIVVDKSFEIRHLVYGMTLITALYILEINQKRSNVYLAENEALINLTPGPDGADADLEDPFDDWNFRGQRLDQELFHQYVNQIDKFFGQFMNERKLPFVVAASDETVNYFLHNTDHSSFYIGALPGNIEYISNGKLMQHLEPILKKATLEKAEAALEEFRKLVGYERGAAGLQTVWQAAKDGRVLHLLVERHYHEPAYLDADGYRITIDPMDARQTYQLEDAVDDLIEEVIERNGDVFFLEPGALGTDKVAAVLRY